MSAPLLLADAVCLTCGTAATLPAVRVSETPCAGCGERQLLTLATRIEEPAPIVGSPEHLRAVAARGAGEMLVIDAATAEPDRLEGWTHAATEYRQAADGSWSVMLFSRAHDQWYEVTASSCWCPWWVRRHQCQAEAIGCKHIERMFTLYGQPAQPHIPQVAYVASTEERRELAAASVAATFGDER
jgi:hypothetical protein